MSDHRDEQGLFNDLKDMDDLGIVGSLRGSSLGSDSSLADKVAGDDDAIQQQPFQFRGVYIPPLQPINQATMECLRMGVLGRCEHFWQMTTRLDAQAEGQIKQNIMQCNCHAEPTNLTDQNIYHCSMWWPTVLGWVPNSLRGALRPLVRRAYETYLKTVGYDFSWRTWADDIFAADHPSLRGHSGPGGKSRGAHEHLFGALSAPAKKNGEAAAPASTQSAKEVVDNLFANLKR